MSLEIKLGLAEKRIRNEQEKVRALSKQLGNINQENTDSNTITPQNILVRSSSRVLQEQPKSCPQSLKPFSSAHTSAY